MKTRPYTQRARAAAARETRERVLSAGAALLWETLTPEIRLADVAARAGVSVQTVLRHFGTRENLLAAAEDHLRAEIHAERRAPAGDIPAAVRAIFDHYERRGDGVLRLLAQEYGDDRIRQINDSGRRAHRDWVESVFAPQMAARAEAERAEAERVEAERATLMDLLVVATDVYTWKLLRRDRHLARAEAEARVRRLAAAILASAEGD